MALSYVHFSFVGKIKYFVRLTDEDSCSVLSVIWKMKIYCSQGGGFFWTDLYFILSCQKRDRLMASGIYFQCWFCFQSFKSVETDPQSSLSAGRRKWHLFLLCPQSCQWGCLDQPSILCQLIQSAGKAGQRALFCRCKWELAWSALIHGKEPIVPQFAEGTKEF